MEGDERRANLWNGDHLKSQNGLHQMVQILLILVSGSFGFGAKCTGISTRSNINELLLLLSLIWVLLVLTFAFELANLPHEIKYIRERRAIYNKIVVSQLKCVPEEQLMCIIRIIPLGKMDRMPLVCGTSITALLFTVSSHGNNLMGVTMILAYLAAVAFLHQRRNMDQHIPSRRRGAKKHTESVDTTKFSSNSDSNPCDSDDLEGFTQDPPPFRVTLTRHSTTTNSDD